ncbi:MAG: helix-turn-helix domain-containing protein, partial [Lactococcus lactis]|nr:helix-turn-helix domain-containing protein [Lactococcus lactis]
RRHYMLWEAIEKELNKQDKTLYWLAKETKKEKSFYYRVKNGIVKTINLDTAIKIADALEISLDEFRKQDTEHD